MIRMARAGDLPQIRSLWEACFPDDTGFNPYFFEHVFKIEETALLFRGEKLCAMTQMMLYSLRENGYQTIPVTYIYGACTAPDERKKGYMAQLLRWTFDRDIMLGRKASILIPQEPWLFDFYAKYGYQPAFYTREETLHIPPKENPAVRRAVSADIPQLADFYYKMTADVSMIIQRASAVWQKQLDLFDALGKGCYLLHCGNELCAYAFVWELQDRLWAQELLAVDDLARDALCGVLSADCAALPVTYTTFGGQKPLGCVRFHNGHIAENGYFNLLFN